MSNKFQSQFLNKLKEKANSPRQSTELKNEGTEKNEKKSIIKKKETKDFLKDSIFVQIINKDNMKLEKNNSKINSKSSNTVNNNSISNSLDGSLVNESKTGLLKKRTLFQRKVENSSDDSPSSSKKSPKSQLSKVKLKSDYEKFSNSNSQINFEPDDKETSFQKLILKMPESENSLSISNISQKLKKSLSKSSEKSNNSSFKKQASDEQINPSNSEIPKKVFKEDEENKEETLKGSELKTKLSKKPSKSENLMSQAQDNNRRLYKKEKICESDTEDEGSADEKEVKWIILPDNRYKQIFDVLIALIILYSSIVLPYNIAFIDVDLDYDDKLDQVFNALFTLDIILNFFSAYTDVEDNVIKSRRKIVVSYLKGWFTIDLISVLPIDSLMNMTTGNVNALARLSRIPKLYRLVRLTKLFRMTKILKKGNVNKVTKFFLDKLKVNANIERLVYFILGFLLLNHLAACIWYFVAKLEDLNPDCWVTRLGYMDATNMEIYIASFYWTLTTVTTVGYGDINAGTTLERIYNLVIMSFGVLMYSFAIGSLSSIVSTLDAYTAEMNQKLQILSSIRKEFGLDQEIYDKVRKVIKYDLSRNQKDKMNFLQELPNKLRIELSQIMHDSVIQKMYFFKDQPSDFIAYVAPLLKPVKFSQNDFLYKEGDLIDEMYFISKGTVSFCFDSRYLEKEIKEVKKHNNFGEIEMCLNEKLSFNIKIKSRNCELFVLKKNDFLRLSVNFKEFIEKFLQRSLMIYLRFNDEKKKIKKQIEDQIKKNTQYLNNLAGKNGLALGNKSSKDGLEIVDEKEEEDESEEYDIFGENSESSMKSSSSSRTESKESKKLNNKKSGKTSSSSKSSETSSNSEKNYGKNKSSLSRDNIEENLKKEECNNSNNSNTYSNNSNNSNTNNNSKRKSNEKLKHDESVSNINNETLKKDNSNFSPSTNTLNFNNVFLTSKKGSNKDVTGKNQIKEEAPHKHNFNINNNQGSSSSPQTQILNNKTGFHLLSNPVTTGFNQRDRRQSILNPSLVNMFTGNTNNNAATGNLNNSFSTSPMFNAFNKDKEIKEEDESINRDENNSDREKIEKVDQMKSQMNKKFIKKVEKIIEFLEKNKIEYDDSPTSHNNPILLLKKLKNVNDLSERNEIIDKIESIISDIFNKYEKKTLKKEHV